MCQSLLLNNVAGLRRATLLKKRLWHRCFLVNFAKFFRTPFFMEHLFYRIPLVAASENASRFDDFLKVLKETVRESLLLFPNVMSIIQLLLINAAASVIPERAFSLTRKTKKLVESINDTIGV